MGKIKVLSDLAINQIAAGEVIENPASCVKELVENSLDAGSNRIDIEIIAGGRQRITIVDDGCGMEPDDAILAFERHATSKLKEPQELLNIGTMGFRGEALASIASVAKVKLITRAVGKDLGFSVVIHGGRLLSSEPCPAPFGTRLEIEELFYNTPARKAFLKSPSHDSAQIAKTIGLLALSHPKVRFSFSENGEKPKVYIEAKEEALHEKKERISAFWGKEMSQNLLPIDEKGQTLRVHGFITDPSIAKQTRSQQFFFINKRSVHSPLLSYAVEEAYATALPQGKHPGFILHLDLPTDWVDVNVHPQKKEVRFRREKELREWVREAVSKHLYSTLNVALPTAPISNSSSFEPRISLPSFSKPYSSFSSSKDYSTPVYLEKKEVAQPFAFAEPQVKMEKGVSEKEALPLLSPLPWEKQEEPQKVEAQASFAFANALHVEAVMKEYALLRGKLPGLDHEEGVAFLRIRGMKARLLFDAKKKGFQKESLQQLLLPVVLEGPFPEGIQLADLQKELLTFGMDAEVSGPHSLTLYAVSPVFKEEGLKQEAHELIEAIATLAKSSVAKREENLAKWAVKSASRLPIGSKEEVTRELKELLTASDPYVDPRGKPIFAILPFSEVEELF